MKRIFPILSTALILTITLTSLKIKSTLNRDAFDTISLYQNDSLISRWSEFDSPKDINLNMNLENDTLTFLCSTDVGWMDSSSLALTTNFELHHTLRLVPFIDPNILKMHYKLPGTNISTELRNIQVWRNTSSKKGTVIFNLRLLEYRE